MYVLLSIYLVTNVYIGTQVWSYCEVLREKGSCEQSILRRLYEQYWPPRYSYIFGKKIIVLRLHIYIYIYIVLYIKIKLMFPAAHLNCGTGVPKVWHRNSCYPCFWHNWQENICRNNIYTTDNRGILVPFRLNLRKANISKIKNQGDISDFW